MYGEGKVSHLSTLLNFSFNLALNTIILSLERKCGTRTQVFGELECRVRGGILGVDLLDGAMALEGGAVDGEVESWS